jgi:hypothetical protein
MNNGNGERLADGLMTAVVRHQTTPGRKSARAEIVALIHEFNAAVTSPGGAPRARSILDRTINALDRRLAERAREKGESVPADGQGHARILQELKAVRIQWSESDTARASEVHTVSLDFVHTMDSLLMFEVARAEGEAAGVRAQGLHQLNQLRPLVRRVHGRERSRHNT